jgi:hypothetical protein
MNGRCGRVTRKDPGASQTNESTGKHVIDNVGDLEKVVASKEGRVRLIKHEIIITCKSISGTLSETPRVSQLVEHAINTIRIVLLGYIPGKRLHTW